ncbi:MAG: M23 family metallopeptidase [Pyrinomonadaceae bacterium]
MYLILIHLLAALFVYEQWINPFFAQSEIRVEDIKDPTEVTTVPTPLPIPSIAASTPFAEELNSNQSQAVQPTDSPDSLMIPVVGIKREQLQDTFNDSRSEGRVHNAIDIIAPLGTPVVAVSDGEIAKFFDSVRGGITIYQYSPDKKYVYYYGHLEKRADNIKETDFVKRGTVIGYVGDTGSSGAGNYHLHFSITLLNDPKRIFDGTEINPYPLLKNGVEAQQ